MSASVPSRPSPAGGGASRSGQQAPGLTLTAAAPGDHPAVHHFLKAVFQEPTRHEFKSSLQDPFYEPPDRVLLKRGARIVGHAHVTQRVAQFGAAQVPVAALHWLAVAPEFRMQGNGRRLLAAAETRMVEDGAPLGLLRTRCPYFFRPAGWALCGRHSYAQADPRNVLAVLRDERPAFGRKTRPLCIRPWRRMELGSLVRIYHQNLPGTYGPYQRTPAYWQWLLDRRAFDQLFVAFDGPDRHVLDDRDSSIVGYAVIRAERVVELMAAPGRPTVASQLLARACLDAMERGWQTVRLYAPPDSPLYRAFAASGRARHLHDAEHREVFMARLLDPVRMLEALGPELLRRAAAAALARPLDLGLEVEGRKFQLHLARDAVTASAGAMGRSYLRLGAADFTRLVLGQLDWQKAADDGRLSASTQLAALAGRSLFPAVPLWRPPLDDLPAIDQPAG